MEMSVVEMSCEIGHYNSMPLNNGAITSFISTSNIVSRIEPSRYLHAAYSILLLYGCLKSIDILMHGNTAAFINDLLPPEK